jgi:hypothetical protein
MDKKSSATLAKLARQAGNMYSEVSSLFNAPSLVTHFERSWVAHTQMKVCWGASVWVCRGGRLQCMLQSWDIVCHRRERFKQCVGVGRWHTHHSPYRQLHVTVADSIVAYTRQGSRACLSTRQDCI